MNYRELLKKFMCHVADKEIDLHLYCHRCEGELFTTEEWDELVQIEKEVKQKIDLGDAEEFSTTA